MLTCCLGIAIGAPELAAGNGSEDEFIASHKEAAKMAAPRIGCRLGVDRLVGGALWIDGKQIQTGLGARGSGS